MAGMMAGRGDPMAYLDVVEVGKADARLPASHSEHPLGGGGASWERAGEHWRKTEEKISETTGNGKLFYAK